MGSFLPVPLRHRKSLPCCRPHCNQGLPPCLYRVLFHSPKRFKRIIVLGGVDPEWQFTRQWQCLPGLPMEAGITVAAAT